MYIDIVILAIIIIVLTFGLFVYYQNLPIKNSGPIEYKKCKKLTGAAIITIISTQESHEAAKLMSLSARMTGYKGRIIFAHYQYYEMNTSTDSDIEYLDLSGKFELVNQIGTIALLHSGVGKAILVDSNMVWLANPQEILDSLNDKNVLIQWAEMASVSTFDHIRRQVREFVPYIVSGNPITEQASESYVSNQIVAINLNSCKFKNALLHISEKLGWYNKEMYWVAAEMARVGYTIVGPGRVLMVGKLTMGMLCGTFGYADDAGNLIAVSGNIKKLVDADTIGIGTLNLNHSCVTEPQTLQLDPTITKFINLVSKKFYH